MAGLGSGSEASGSVLLNWHEKVRFHIPPIHSRGPQHTFEAQEHAHTRPKTVIVAEAQERWLTAIS